MKTIRFLLPALAALWILHSSALSLPFRSLLSSTRSFSFDGQRYSVGPSGEGDFSLIRRELSKSGIDLPDDREMDTAPHPALSVSLHPEGPAPPAGRSFLPPGFETEHSLRLVSDEGPVEISFGRTHRSSREAAGLLRARGWRCTVSDPAGTGGFAAEYRSGKERLLAFLDPKGEGFLLLRRLE